jgi:peptidoglycan/LPS O-acetylase OafA/YrhL
LTCFEGLPHPINKSVMLLLIRVVTIIVSIAWLALGGFFIVAGMLEKPEADTGAIWIGTGIFVFYLANLYLLYRSYKKKHSPTHWVAFLLSILPALALVVLVYVLDKADL